MMRKVLIMFLICTSSFAQNYIECDSSLCNYDPELSLQSQGGGNEHSSASIVPLLDTLSVTRRATSNKREARLYVETRSPYGQDLAVDLSDMDGLDGSSDFTLIGDILGNLNISLNGTFGQDGKSASQVCKENFLSGVYGSDALSYFQTRRDEAPEDNPVSPNCDVQDLEWVRSNKFSCPENHNLVSGEEIEVERIIKKRHCQGFAQFSRCVRRTKDVTCRFERIGKFCCDASTSWSNYFPNGVYLPPLSGESCDPSKCEESSTFNSAQNNFKTGAYQEVTYSSVFESEILRLGGEELWCREEAQKNEIVAKYVSVDQYGNTNETTTQGASYVSGYNHNHFKIPYPNTIEASTDENIEGVMINTSKSTVGVKNCLGLNGSNNNDYQCERISPGGAGKLYIHLTDSLGQISNEITINIPEGRKGQGTIYSRHCHWGGSDWNYGDSFCNIGSWASTYELGENIQHQVFDANSPTCKYSYHHGINSYEHVVRKYYYEGTTAPSHSECPNASLVDDKVGTGSYSEVGEKLYYCPQGNGSGANSPYFRQRGCFSRYY